LAASRILVVPFENVTRDGRIFWLSEASAVLLTDDLNALGASAITREERRRAFDLLQVPAAPALTDATVIRIGQIVGAAQLVIGSLELDGDALVVHARSIALQAGRIQRDVTERGTVGDLFATFERVARAIAPQTLPASPQLDHPVVGAFENYIKGLLAATPPTAITYLNAALQMQPTLDRARLALWDIYDQQGDHEHALAAVQQIPAGSAWARRGQFRAGLSELNLKKYDEAFAAFNAIAERDPSGPVLNNLGVVQLRRGGTPQSGGQATYFFDKAAAADATDADYFFNLGYAYWSERDMQASVYWLREAVRRNPADGEAHFVLGAALASLSAAGNATEANREKELARRLSSTFAEWEKRPGLEAVPRGLERIKSDIELPHALRIDETLANNQQLAGFYLDRARRLYEQENDRDALADLNRVIFLSPYQAEAHLLVGRIHLRGGRVREAIDAFKISLWSTETADAHAALAEAYLEAKDVTAARAEAERALALAPASAAAKQILGKIPH
jgi:tetratricopeptide (TPR) repeat protein